MVKFTVGQFVYVKDSHDARHDKACPEILKVVAEKESGDLVLVGKCGTTISVNAVNCAPCHREIHDQHESPQIEAFRPGKEFPCVVCHLPDDDKSMILCDSCNRGWHYYCVTPPLTKVPHTRLWVCPQCTDAGVVLDKLKTLRQYELTKFSRSGGGPSQPVVAGKQSMVPAPPLRQRGPGRPRKHPLPTVVSTLTSFDWV